MKKRYSIHPLLRTIAGFTAITVIGLSTVQPVLAFDSLDGQGTNSNAQIYGLSFTGNLNFSKMSVNSFAYTPIDGMSGSYYDAGIVSFSNGLLKTDLPLLTFGNQVRYPGILYNHNGKQFSDHVAAAAEGDEESENLIWAYAMAGLTVGGIIYTMSEATDNDTPPVVEETEVESEAEETVVEEVVSTTDTLDTTIESTTTTTDSTTTTVPVATEEE